MSIILSLETSCDESAAALVSNEKGKIDLLANEIASQIDEHANWGGVVPEIASRRHLENLPFLIEEVFAKSKLQIKDIDAVAATVTPGLAGSLLIGSITARTLANLHQIPFLGIHHLEGHLSSIYLSENHPKPPFLVLLVSGGHTELIKVDVKHKYVHRPTAPHHHATTGTPPPRHHGPGRAAGGDFPASGCSPVLVFVLRD